MEIKMKKLSVLILILMLVSAACGTAEKQQHEAELKFLEQNVESTDENYIAGKKALEEGNLSAAVDYFQKSSFSLAKFYEAAALNELGRKEEAEAAFRQCVEKDVLKTESLYNLAMLSFDKGNPEEAKSYAGEALKNEPNHLASLFFSGNLSYNAGDMETALKYYEKCIKIDPRSKDFRDALFLVYLQMNRYEEAWKLAKKLSLDDPVILTSLLQVAEITGRYLEGADLVPEELLTGSREVRSMVIILLTKGGNLRKAIELAKADLKPEKGYIVLDRSTDRENGYVFAVTADSLFLTCAGSRDRQIPAEFSEPDVRILDYTIPMSELSSKLGEICAGK